MDLVCTGRFLYVKSDTSEFRGEYVYINPSLRLIVTPYNKYHIDYPLYGEIESMTTTIQVNCQNIQAERLTTSPRC